MWLFYYLVLFSTMPKHRLVETEILGLTLVKWLGGLCFLYALVRCATAGKFPALFGCWQLRFSYVLFAAAALSWSLHSSYNEIAFSPITAYLSFAILLFISTVLIDSASRFRSTVLFVIGSATVASFYVLREFQKAGFRGRPGWIAGDSNYFGICALLVIPVAFYLWRSDGPLWRRRACLLALLIVLPAFTITSSRGAFVGLCVSGIYGVVISRRGWKDVALLFIVLAPLMLFLPSSPVSRFLNPARGDTEAVDIRESLWKAGLHMFEEHPLFGVGVGKFSSAIDASLAEDLNHRYIAHNTYLEYAAELGIVGLTLYLGIVCSCFYTFSKIRRFARLYRDSFWFHYALGSECGIIGYAVAAFFLSAEYQKLFWVFVGLSAVLPNIAKQNMAARAKAQASSVMGSMNGDIPEAVLAAESN